MRDPRYEKLARLIIEYSLDLERGASLRIDGSSVASPLILALHRAALARGAHPYVNVEVEGLRERLVEEGSDEQLTFISPIERNEVEWLDAVVTVWSEVNTRSFSRVDPLRQQQLIVTHRQLAIRRRERISRGEMKWCGTLSPTHAHAQEAELSLEEYEDFVFRACHIHDDDPVAHWRGISDQLRARAQSLADARELRILGDDTDLRVVVDGRTWQPSSGTHNMPDGEVYTSPVETGTEGTIRFTFPALFEGREVEDVRLRFDGGRVVKAEAARGERYLNALLDMDPGARVLGEAAFGLNYEIDRFTRNILFDEKIGGTMHFALGMGFEDLGSHNQSALHWDLICDLRRDGEVYADGELIWRAGAFVGEPTSAVRAVERV
jgi:aminopeptidase